MGRRSFGNVLEVPKRKGWYVRFSWRGRRYWRCGGPTAAIARGKLARLQLKLESGTELEVAMHEVFGDPVGRGMTFKEAVPQYREYTLTRKKDSTLKSDQYRLRTLIRGAWAAKSLIDIRREDLARWSQERLKEGACGVTVDHDLNLGSALFEWAIEMGYAVENPFKRVKRFNLKGRERGVYLTPEECRALVAAASKTMKPILILALSTAMRRGEVLSLTWRAIDFANGTVTIAADLSKNGKKRVIRMTNDLHRELAALFEERKSRVSNGSDVVFTRHNGRRNGTPISSGVIRNGMKAVLLAVKGVIPEEKRIRFRFHDLRHTAAALMTARGTPIFDVSKVLGHSGVGVTLRYAGFAPDAGRLAIENLGQALAFSAPA